MKFRPVISIMLGFTTASVAVICIFILSSFILHNTNFFNSDIDVFNWFLIGSLFALLFGGFITTYVAKEKNKRYSVYTGLLLTAAFFILNTLTKISGIHNANFISLTMFLIILVPAITCIGGYLGKLLERNNQNKS